MSEKLVSIVVPMYFEEKVVEECYKRLNQLSSKAKLITN
jgi:dolichol-phosphate mannosyltransferase